MGARLWLSLCLRLGYGSGMALRGLSLVAGALICWSLCSSVAARAATLPVGAAPVAAAPVAAVPQEVAPPREASHRAVGLTVDLLPIVLSATAGQGGLSGQVWAGFDHVRLRLVGARLALPNWLAAKDGFEDQTTLAVAAIADYVFGDHFDRWWIGAGLEWWHNSIGQQDVPGRRVAWDAGVATMGGGYIWPLLGDRDVHFYLEPWGAAHVRWSAASPTLEGRTYAPPRVNAELSLKLGVFFDL